MPPSHIPPPRFATWLLERTVAFSDSFAVLGDLEEEFAERCIRHTPAQARAWYWRQMLWSLPLFLVQSFRWGCLMLQNYLKVTLRNLTRHKGYAFLNIAGLGFGLACTLIIFLFVRNELSYDRFHDQADQIYRVEFDLGTAGNVLEMALSPTPTAEAFRATFPEIEAATRVYPSIETVRRDAQRFRGNRVYFADSTFFDVFSFELLQGDPHTALSQPNSIVVTEAMATKYFGHMDVVGQTLEVNDQSTYTITGLLADLPTTTHFAFDFLASFTTLSRSQSTDWFSGQVYTYLMLAEHAQGKDLEAKFNPFFQSILDEPVRAIFGASFEEVLASGNATYNAHLTPLTAIHLHSKKEWEIAPTSDIAYVYIYGAIGLFILLIACINFMNLTTARSAKRAREVGLRKVLGAHRNQLTSQFLGESLILTLLATLVAVGLTYLLLPFFNDIAGKDLVFQPLGDPIILGGIIVLLGTVGLASGLYPALFLSAFRPTTVLKGKLLHNAQGQRLRQVLVVVQFSISIFLLIGTGVVLSQLDYLQNKKLGFAQDQVIILPTHEDSAVYAQAEAFKESLLQHAQVHQITSTQHYPGGPLAQTGYVPGDASVDDMRQMWAMWASYDFLETLDAPLVAGRSFSRAFATDTEAAFVINEAAARSFGWDDPIGQTIRELENITTDTWTAGTIVGVVQDFHFESLHQEIRPLVIRIDEAPSFVLARVQADHLSETLAFIESQWNAFGAENTFRYWFLDDDFAEMYQTEERLSRTFSYFSLLAILIACLGLFGLAAFIAEQRTMEIGIRKVLGASVGSLIVLLSREFSLLVGVAFAVATPLAYIIMNEWLASFAYRTSVSLWLVLTAGLIALTIAWVTVSYQALKAALTDPVKALRYE